MLPLCNRWPMHMPMNPGMMGIRPVMVPMLPAPTAPAAYPSNNINIGLSTTRTNEYDSHMYGRFRHVERDYPHYRHIPFDWYQPPKQQYNVVHEDAAVVTLHGPVPIDEFYRYYIYDKGMDDSDSDPDYYDDSTSSESEEYDEPSYEERNTNYRRQSRRKPDFDDDDYEEENMTQPLYRQPMNYPTYNSKRPPTIPLPRVIRPSNYLRNRSSPGNDDFDDTASLNSTYDN